MFGDLSLVWKLWGWWDQLKGGHMDAATIQAIITTLGPLVTPVIAALLTRLLRAGVLKLSDRGNHFLSPYLPFVSGLIGAVYAGMVGDPVVVGIVGGLAGVGLHQIPKQMTTPQGPPPPKAP